MLAMRTPGPIEKSLNTVMYRLWRGLGLFFTTKNELLVGWVFWSWVFAFGFVTPNYKIDSPLWIGMLIVVPIILVAYLYIFRPPPFLDLPEFMLREEYQRVFDKWCWQHMASWRKRRLRKKLDLMEAAFHIRRWTAGGPIK